MYQNKQFIKFPFFRVPLIVSKTPRRFNFGFASNMALLLWCVCGGFLFHMLGCNYFTMLVKANYEKPVDTVEDVIDRGLAILEIPTMESIVEMLQNSPFYQTRILAERTIVPKVIICFIDLTTNLYNYISGSRGCKRFC